MDDWKKELARLLRKNCATCEPGETLTNRLADALDPLEPPKPKFKRGDWVCTSDGRDLSICLDSNRCLSLGFVASRLRECWRPATISGIVQFVKRQPYVAVELMQMMSRIIAGEEPKD